MQWLLQKTNWIVDLAQPLLLLAMPRANWSSKDNITIKTLIYLNNIFSNAQISWTVQVGILKMQWKPRIDCQLMKNIPIWPWKETEVSAQQMVLKLRIKTEIIMMPLMNSWSNLSNTGHLLFPFQLMDSVSTNQASSNAILLLNSIMPC